MHFAFPLVRAALSLPLIAVLAGCVAGQTINLDYAPDEAPKVRSAAPVMVSVKDNRPFVVSGDKKPSYLGHYRAGLGNTWDVHTTSGEALAAEIQRDLAADLKALGFTVASGAPRKVQVTINDWNFDGYINGRVRYDINVAVLGGTDSVLARHDIQDIVAIEGSALTGPKAAFERELPKIYRAAIRRMVRENTAALQALQK